MFQKLIVFNAIFKVIKFQKMVFSSPGRGLRVVALTENAILSGITDNRCFTTVVFPEPEGAEKMMSLPNGLLFDQFLRNVGVFIA